jgi:DNA-binding XRE family transcriptional regulator
VKPGPRPKPIADRFWPKVNKIGPVPPHCPSLGPCWIWTGSKTSHGYGDIGSGGKHGRNLRAHRVAYELAHGPIPEGMCVLHRCDNPPCVRADHLFLGTMAMNSADMVTKGRGFPQRFPERMVRGAAHPLRKDPSLAARGERVGGAKLTADDVRSIRRSAESQRVMARRFGVSRRSIAFIQKGRTWRHVKDDARIEIADGRVEVRS